MKNKIFSFFKEGNDRTIKAKYNILYSLLLKCGGILLSLIIIPLTLDSLTAYEYGVWLTLSSILVWVNYFDIGLGNGLRNKLAEALALNNLKLAKAYVATALFVLGFIVLGIIILFMIINHFIQWDKVLNIADNQISNIDSIVSIVFILFCISFFFKIIGNIYLALQLPAVNDLLNFLGSFLSFVIIYILTKTHSGDLFGIALAFSLSPVIVYAFSFPVTFHRYKELRPGWGDIKMEYARGLLGLGIQFFFLQIAVLVIFSTSNFLISQFFTSAEVTPYNIAFKYFNIVLMFFGILVSPFWTAITDAYIKKDFLWIKKSLVTMISIWSGCVVLLAMMTLASKQVYAIWLQDKVDISYSLSFAMAVYMAIATWNQIFTSLINGIGRIKLQLYLAIFEAIIFVPLAYKLSAMLGLKGIVYAMSFVLFISAIALPLQSFYILKTKS